jgi:Fic family protein
MADWDDNSPELGVNLAELSLVIRSEAALRTVPTIAAVRGWHRLMMRGLNVPKPEYVGRYRGEPGVEGVNVRIGHHYGVRSDLVAGAVAEFEDTLQRALAALDEDIDVGQELTGDQFKAVIDLCAWAHSEWARIHPFANGNGRVARLWANYVAMRYGLPAFARLRPRPDSPYDEVASEAMHGQWQTTVPLFRQMCRHAMRRRPSP